MPAPRAVDPPAEVVAIRQQLVAVLDEVDANGLRFGDAKCGLYAFYDYDGEPIYVGQTWEKLRVRIRRHLTNQRTDAVSMSVLDPFEVAEIEMWPVWEFQKPHITEEIKAEMRALEYSVLMKMLEESTFGAVLNEGTIAAADARPLPPSARRRIIPDDIYERRKHPDIRIARRALTISRLAGVIAERQVSDGLRQTLVTQARRLEHLATRRRDEIAGDE